MSKKVAKETKKDCFLRNLEINQIIEKSAERAGQEGNKAFFEKLGVEVVEPKGIGQFENVDQFMSATSGQRDSAIRHMRNYAADNPAKFKRLPGAPAGDPKYDIQYIKKPTVRKKTLQFVVLVPRKGYSIDVYGPYKVFKTAEGDAQAWGGSVHPVDPISQGHL